MKLFSLALSALTLIIVVMPQTSFAQTKIRDIVDVEGVRTNELLGYGIVVGLNGTGDSVRNSPQTEDTLSSMLERLGVNVQGEEIKPNNVAAVMVTAKLPPFARMGSSIDVSVASIGDASDLRGGTLILTPLTGTDNNVYAVAQGQVIVSGLDVQAEGARQSQGTPTSGTIPNGATVEREVNFALVIAMACSSLFGIPTFQRRPLLSNPSMIQWELAWRECWMPALCN